MAQTEDTMNEDFFKTILENSYDAIAVFDAKGITRYISPSVTNLHGYKPKELISEPPLKVVHPDDIVSAQELFSTLLAHPGETFKGNIRILTKKGLIKDVAYRATNLLDSSSVRGIIVNFRDISDRVKIEKKLLESEERCSLIVEKGNDSFIIAQNGLIVFANGRALELVGYTKEEVVGSPFDKFIAPEYQELVATRFRQRIQNEEIPHIYEIDLLSKDDRVIPVEINSSLAYYKGKPASITVIRDIRARKDTEKQIKAAAKTQSALLNSMRDIALLVTTDFIAIDCNQVFAESIGVPKEKIIGNNVTQFFPPDILESRIQKAMTCIKEKRMVQFQDTRSERWFDNIFFPITDEQGAINQLAVYIRDITEDKRILEKLAEQQKLSALGQISSVIAHELNTPLATIDLTAQILKVAVGEAFQSDVETIRSEVKRASALVADILGFTTMGPLEFRDVKLKELVETVVHRQKQLHDIGQVIFDVALSDETVYGDVNKLGLALENIIKNAILARKSPNELHAIRIYNNVENESLMVTVQDTGEGIDEKDIFNIFKPFFTTREQGSGSGLGLYIAEWIIKGHNGSICVESTKEEGSTFTITIPHSRITEHQ